MPSDGLSHDSLGKQEQWIRKAVIGTCLERGIDSPSGVLVVVTEKPYEEAAVIETGDLPDLLALAPELLDALPPQPWREDVLEESRYLAIIPRWLVDHIGSCCGDRDAASRVAASIQWKPPKPILSALNKQARSRSVSSRGILLAVKTDAVLAAVTNQREPLPIQSPSNAGGLVSCFLPLKDTDGQPLHFAPTLMTPFGFRLWLAVETIRITEAALMNQEYVPAIRLDGSPYDLEPAGDVGNS